MGRPAGAQSTAQTRTEPLRRTLPPRSNPVEATHVVGRVIPNRGPLAAWLDEPCLEAEGDRSVEYQKDFDIPVEIAA